MLPYIKHDTRQTWLQDQWTCSVLKSRIIIYTNTTLFDGITQQLLF